MATMKKAVNGTTTTKTTIKPKSDTWYKEGEYKKAYDESSFQDDIDRNKQPYPKNVDMINTKSKSTATHKTLPPTKKLKMKNGGSLTGLKASNKRVGPVDPKGAFTKVQKKTLAGARTTAKLTKDKQLGATKMAKCGTKMSKK